MNEDNGRIDRRAMYVKLKYRTGGTKAGVRAIALAYGKDEHPSFRGERVAAGVFLCSDCKGKVSYSIPLSRKCPHCSASRVVERTAKALTIALHREKAEEREINAALAAGETLEEYRARMKVERDKQSRKSSITMALLVVGGVLVWGVTMWIMSIMNS